MRALFRFLSQSMTARSMRSTILVGSCGWLSCSSDPPESYLELTTGEESDAFNRAPSPTEIVALRLPEGKEMARTRLPARDFGIGDLQNEETLEVRIEARDAAGAPLLLGFAGPVAGNVLSGRAIPVFISRVGEFARMPGLLAVRKDPLVDVVAGRYLVSVDRGSDTSDLYDLFSLAPLPNPPRLPRIPKSMVAVGMKLLLVSNEGATFLDLSNSIVEPASLPFDPTDVAGGHVAKGEKGSVLLVGNSTRGSKKALRISPEGTFSTVELSVERNRPAVSYAEGIGFVIAGGAAAGSPDVEIVPEEGASSFPLTFQSDLASDAAMDIADDGSAIIASGTSIFRYDLACRTTCARTQWKAILPFPSTAIDVQGPSSEERALLLARKEDGESLPYLVAADQVTLIPFRIPHFGASALPLSGRTYFIGGATKIETWARAFPL